jgi:hypothetical protein
MAQWKNMKNDKYNAPESGAGKQNDKNAQFNG